jgi:hypothetical protein
LARPETAWAEAQEAGGRPSGTGKTTTVAPATAWWVASSAWPHSIVGADEYPGTAAHPCWTAATLVDSRAASAAVLLVTAVTALDIGGAGRAAADHVLADGLPAGCAV